MVGFAPKRLSDGIDETTTEDERRALNLLSDAIEVVREELRPIYGKARTHARGFHPANRDFVDTLSWEEVLTKHGAAVVAACSEKGLSREYLLHLARARSNSETTRDAIMWLETAYRAAEIAHKETRAIVKRETTDRQRSQMSEMGKGRFKNAKRLALEMADEFLKSRSIKPSKAATVRYIKRAVCDAAANLDKCELEEGNADRTITGWLNKCIDGSRFKSRKKTTQVV